MSFAKQTFGDLKAIKDELDMFTKLWSNVSIIGQTCVISQSEFFKKNIPVEPVDFTDTYSRTKLDTVFTNKKFCTPMRGSYNCNMVYRQSQVMPDVMVYSNEHYVVFHPLGEPGRDLGTSNYRMSHLMVVSWNTQNTPFTLNEMIPSSSDEIDDLDARNVFLEDAFEALASNCPVSDCGDKVIQRATDMGVSSETRIRDFMALQISSFTPDFRDVSVAPPGYILKDSTNVNVSDSSEKVKEMIESTFTNTSLTIVKCIQSPHNCSQLLSHIHGFLLPARSSVDTIPSGIYDNYICSENILYLKQLVRGDYEPIDDKDNQEVELVRQSAVPN